MRFRIGYILPAMMLAALQCAAQAVVPRHVIDSIANPPMAEDRALAFERTEIGSILVSEDDAPSEHTFRFTNRGGEPLVITRVETSCGCLTASYDRRPVEPGKEGEIVVKYDPRGHSGKLMQRAFVYTAASGNRPAARLTLDGEVTPSENAAKGYRLAMGPLRLRTKTVAVGDVGRAGSRTERIECLNTGSKSLRLKAMAGITPGWISLRTEPEVIAPGQTADLVITVDGARIPAGAKGNLTQELVVEGIDIRPSERVLYVTLHVE